MQLSGLRKKLRYKNEMWMHGWISRSARMLVFSVASSTQVGMAHHGNISITDNVLSTDIRVIIEPSPGPQECSPGPEELVPAHAFLVSGMMTLPT